MVRLIKALSGGYLYIVRIGVLIMILFICRFFRFVITSVGKIDDITGPLECGINEKGNLLLLLSSSPSLPPFLTA